MMTDIKINLTFDVLTFRKIPVELAIRKCIVSTLRAEGVDVP